MTGNDKTIEAFKENGFAVMKAASLIEKLESGEMRADEMTDTIILMPSAELSRARGVFIA